MAQYRKHSLLTFQPPPVRPIRRGLTAPLQPHAPSPPISLADFKGLVIGAGYNGMLEQAMRLRLYSLITVPGSNRPESALSRKQGLPKLLNFRCQTQLYTLLLSC